LFMTPKNSFLTLEDIKSTNFSGNNLILLKKYIFSATFIIIS
jgi:hypothetical protein